MKLIHNLVLIACCLYSFAVKSSPSTQDAVAIIIDLMGKGCVVNESYCSPVQTGQYLYNQEKIIIDGNVTIVDLEEKTWNSLQSGTYTITKASNTPNEKEQAKSKRSAIFQSHTRQTATLSTRNDSYSKVCHEHVTLPTEYIDCFIEPDNEIQGAGVQLIEVNGNPVPPYSAYIDLPEKMHSTQMLASTYSEACKAQQHTINISAIAPTRIKNSIGREWILVPLSKGCRKKFIAEKEKLDRTFENKSSRNYLWSLSALYERYELNFDAAQVFRHLVD